MTNRIFWEVVVTEPDGTPHVGHAIIADDAEPQHVVGMVGKLADVLTEHALEAERSISATLHEAAEG